MNKIQKDYINYTLKVQKTRDIAKSVGNVEFVKICNSLLFPSSIKKYSSYVMAQKAPPKQYEEEDVDTPNGFVEIDEPAELGDVDYEVKTEDPFKTTRIKDFKDIQTQDFTDNNKLENELKSSVIIAPDGTVYPRDMEKIQRFFAIVFFKYAEDMANIAVAHFMGLPETIRTWAVNSVVPEQLVSRYSNKLMQETTVSNISRLRGKNFFNPERLSDGEYAPSEIDENVIGREIVDRALQVLLNNNGIYLGNIQSLLKYTVTGKTQAGYTTKLPKNARMRINVDPDSIEGRAVQGLGKLIFTVVAQQFMERWGATSYAPETYELKYRHIGNELHHPSKQLSWEDPGFGNPALRNVFMFAPGGGRRHGLTLQDEQEFILRKIFDMNESGQQAFNELYDVRINKSDQKYVGQHAAVDATMLSEKIVENFRKLFGYIDVSGNRTKATGSAFKTLFAFYLYMMGFLKEGKGGWQSENTSTIKVPPKVLKALGIPFDKSKINRSDRKMSDDGQTVMYDRPYIPITPFGMDNSAARAVWKINEEKILGPQIDVNNIVNASTPREIYYEIQQQLRDPDHIKAMNRIVANSLKQGIEKLFKEKLIELIENRQDSMASGQPVQNPKWNAPGNAAKDKSQHEWAEYAAIIYAFMNDVDAISQILPFEVVKSLTENSQAIKKQVQ